MSRDEWTQGPAAKHRRNMSKFIELDLLEPTRYAMGIIPSTTNPWDKVAFIAVDPENLSSKYYSPDTFQDHGDDVIPPYDRGSIRHGRDMIPPLANNNDEEEDPPTTLLLPRFINNGFFLTIIEEEDAILLLLLFF